MKSRNVIFATAILFSAVLFAQKEELKTLKKIYEKEKPSSKDVMEYISVASAAEPLVAAGSDSDKVYLEFYKANIPVLEFNDALAKADNKNSAAISEQFFTPEKIMAIANAYSNTIDFEKKAGKEILTKKIQENANKLKPVLITMAVSIGNAGKYKESAKILHSMYLLDKKDVEKLYYSAGYAVNGQDYDNALAHYNELIALNYSGERTIYYAKNAANNQEDNFDAKADRDRYVMLKTHTDPRDEKVPSRRGEIYKNVALIYQTQGKVEDAKRVIKEAVRLNPDDTGLMLTEANLYLETKDMVTYKTLITGILAKNPSNSELYYNLGVIAYNNKQMGEAETMYKKAIEIDPKNANANLNMAILKLDAEKDIIGQMNKLGSTPADNKKYDVLKVQRNNLFTGALPYLEKSVELDPKNKEAAATLLSVYKALEMMDKVKALKEKIGATK